MDAAMRDAPLPTVLSRWISAWQAQRPGHIVAGFSADGLYEDASFGIAVQGNGVAPRQAASRAANGADAAGSQRRTARRNCLHDSLGARSGMRRRSTIQFEDTFGRSRRDHCFKELPRVGGRIVCTDDSVVAGDIVVPKRKCTYGA